MCGQRTLSWTPPIVEYLVYLVKQQKFTSREIGDQISNRFKVTCNRGQVIGKADRLGLKIERQVKERVTTRSKFWTVDKLQTLEKMWNENKTVNDIGYHFGISGSSVARAARNHGFSYRDLSDVRNQSNKIKTKLNKTISKAPGTITIERSMDKFMNPAAKKLTFEELKHNSCRYIVGDTMTPNFRYCGVDVPAGYSVPYCDVCRKIVYYPSKYQQKTTEQGATQ